MIPRVAGTGSYFRAVAEILGLPILGLALLGGTAAAASDRWYEPHHAAAGQAIYQQHCAVCHGSDAEGAPLWTVPGKDGFLPPPPLNGTGHAWHHPLRQLFSMIHDGSPGGQGRMPAWRGKLEDGEILAVIAWFQSRWPDEIYAAWARMDRSDDQSL